MPHCIIVKATLWFGQHHPLTRIPSFSTPIAFLYLVMIWVSSWCWPKRTKRQTLSPSRRQVLARGDRVGPSPSHWFVHAVFTGWKSRHRLAELIAVLSKWTNLDGNFLSKSTFTSAVFGYLSRLNPPKTPALITLVWLRAAILFTIFSLPHH